MQREREQTGYIFKRGNWWILRYREVVVENGQPMRRQIAKRIQRVEKKHKRLKRPPKSVEAAAKAILQPVNSGEYIVVLKSGKELSCSRGYRLGLQRLIENSL